MGCSQYNAATTSFIGAAAEATEANAKAHKAWNLPESFIFVRTNKLYNLEDWKLEERDAAAEIITSK